MAQSSDIDLSLWCSRLPKVAAARIRELEAEVAALTAALSDMVVVPKEPTTAMLAAGQQAWLADPMKRSTTLYRAMIAAAPPPSYPVSGGE